jgi:hypothetical protein
MPASCVNAGEHEPARASAQQITEKIKSFLSKAAPLLINRL